MRALNEQEIQWVKNTLQVLAQHDSQAVAKHFAEFQPMEDILPIKFHLLGLAAVQMGNLAEALSLFKKASDLRPEAKIHFEACGICAAKLGMLSDSMFYMKMSATCEEADEFDLSLLPDWLGAIEHELANIEDHPFLKKAQEAYAKQKFADVLSNLQQALNADPFNVESWILIYKTMLRLGRRADALHAIKAAMDSGAVPFEILVNAIPLAKGLGDREAVILLEEKARDSLHLAQEYGQEDYLATKLLEWVDEVESDQCQKARVDWVAQTISAELYGAEITPISQRYNLAILSSRLEVGNGVDPIADFIQDLCQYSAVDWLNIRIYARDEFEERQLRQLNAAANGFLLVDQIDPYTLSRILRNDMVHFVWDLDGWAEVSNMLVHEQLEIPDRFLCGMSDGEFSFTRLNGQKKMKLPFAPFSLRNNSASIAGMERDKIYPDRQMRRIALSVTYPQLTGNLLNIFQKLKEDGQNFQIILDTIALGGVAMVDMAQDRFEAVGLGTYVDFAQPVEYRDEYLAQFYGQADMAVIPSGKMALQIAYDAIAQDCLILSCPALGQDNGQAETYDLLPAFMQEFGLGDSYIKDPVELSTRIKENLEDKQVFIAALNAQKERLAHYSSEEKSEARCQAMIAFLLQRVTQIYGPDFAERLARGEDEA